MAYSQPLLDYQIKVNGVEKELESNTRVSFNPGFNKVQVMYKPTNQSLSIYQIRVTEEHEDWGLGLGQVAFQNQGGIQANVWHEANITLHPDVFKWEDSEGVHHNGVFRLSLCAKGDVDGTWDVKYVLFTLGGLVFKPTDAEAVNLVVTDAVIPENWTDPKFNSDTKELYFDQVQQAVQDDTDVAIDDTDWGDDPLPVEDQLKVDKTYSTVTQSGDSLLID